VGAVIGIDPEPDMLVQARRAAEQRDARNLLWIVGSDRDMQALGRVLGQGRLAAVLIGQALHWMRPESLFGVLAGLVRPGGGVAVVTNGTPLWLQESRWSVALREFLQTSFGWKLDATCGTDEASRARYRRQLADAGFGLVERRVAYEDVLDLDSLVGGLLSAFPVQELPPPQRRREFAARVGRALAPERLALSSTSASRCCSGARHRHRAPPPPHQPRARARPRKLLTPASDDARQSEAVPASGAQIAISLAIASRGSSACNALRESARIFRSIDERRRSCSSAWCGSAM
jgi:SAM-dependent methyltransferase